MLNQPNHPDQNPAAVLDVLTGKSEQTLTDDQKELGLKVLRSLKGTSGALKATESKILIREQSIGIGKHNVQEMSAAMCNKLITEGIGEAGDEKSVRLACHMAELLDLYYEYIEDIKAVPIDLETVHEGLDARTWATTTNNYRNQFKQGILTWRGRMLAQCGFEIDYLIQMMDAIDRTSPGAQEQFERKRLELKGRTPDEIEARISEMHETGLLRPNAITLI